MFVNGSIDRATAKSLADDGVRLVGASVVSANENVPSADNVARPES
jgi:hypothetical protein